MDIHLVVRTIEHESESVIGAFLDYEHAKVFLSTEAEKLRHDRYFKKHSDDSYSDYFGWISIETHEVLDASHQPAMPESAPE